MSDAAAPFPGEARAKSVFEAYVAALDAQDAVAVAALFADGAVIEDPLGKPPITDNETPLEFFTRIVKVVKAVWVEAPVRAASDTVTAGAIVLESHRPNGEIHEVRAVDVMTLDAEGKIVRMQAIHGPLDRTVVTR